VLTPVNYFSVNILQNVSKEFGVSPWWWYLGQLLLNLAPPVSLVFLAAFFLTWYRCPKNPVVWITIPFFLVHCMIAHKEFRFLFPMLYALPALLTLGADTMWPSIVAWCRRRPVAATVRFFLFLFIAVDLTLLLGYSFKPGKEVMAIYKWIYKAGKSEPFTLLTLTHSPYYLGPIPIHFYDAPGVLIRQVQTADSLKGLMRQSGKPATVALRGFALPDSLKDDSLEWKVECRSIPQWLSHFDINHWLSRVRIWTIYSVRRKGS
jgi:phosphatidylinositol glycan class B